MTFLRSAWIISRAFIVNFGIISGGRSILHGAWQLLKAAFTPESDLSRARMDACRKCEMFASNTSSCGVPGETFKRDMIWYGTPLYNRKETLGCWCYLPLANRLPKKDCWGRANGTGFGWPDELRPKE